MLGINHHRISKVVGFLSAAAIMLAMPVLAMPHASAAQGQIVTMTVSQVNGAWDTTAASGTGTSAHVNPAGGGNCS